MVKINNDDGEYYQLHIGRYIFLGIVAIVALIVFFGSFYIVGAGERAVVLTWGNPSTVPMSEGLHLKIPIAQDVVKMDIKTQKYEYESSAASSDLQTVTAKIATNYRLEGSSVPELYKTVGLDYASRVIVPAEQEAVKAVTSKYTAAELITKREEVRNDIKTLLHDKLFGRGIVVEEVAIVNFDFSKSFNDAIEAKVTSEQQALQQKNILEQVKYEAEQRVTKAEAEATAIRIQAEAVQSQGGRDYVQLQAIAKWNGNVPNIVMGSTSAVPFIDLNGLTAKTPDK
jgi:regulator of protease activity HflC (stomatin/prohibitin superfamily)